MNGGCFQRLYAHRRFPSRIQVDESERAVAIWAFEHGLPAGRDTDTLPAAKVRYLPLKTSRGVVGVLGVQPHDETKHLTAEQRHLMEAFANQAALAIERAQLAGEAQQARLQIETGSGVTRS